MSPFMLQEATQSIKSKSLVLLAGLLSLPFFAADTALGTPPSSEPPPTAEAFSNAVEFATEWPDKPRPALQALRVATRFIRPVTQTLREDPNLTRDSVFEKTQIIGTQILKLNAIQWREVVKGVSQTGRDSIPTFESLHRIYRLNNMNQLTKKFRQALKEFKDVYRHSLEKGNFQDSTFLIPYLSLLAESRFVALAPTMDDWQFFETLLTSPQRFQSSEGQEWKDWLYKVWDRYPAPLFKAGMARQIQYLNYLGEQAEQIRQAGHTQGALVLMRYRERLALEWGKSYSHSLRDVPKTRKARRHLIKSLRWIHEALAPALKAVHEATQAEPKTQFVADDPNSELREQTLEKMKNLSSLHLATNNKQMELQKQKNGSLVPWVRFDLQAKIKEVKEITSETQAAIRGCNSLLDARPSVN